MSAFKSEYTTLVRHVVGLENAFSEADLISDVSLYCKEYSVTVRWDGYVGRFSVYDEDNKRWVDWKNPREPLWACSIALEIEALHKKARETAQKNIKAMKDSFTALTLFLSPPEEEETTNGLQTQEQLDQ